MAHMERKPEVGFDPGSFISVKEKKMAGCSGLS